MDATGPTARRFPLVARTRPACDPITDRIQRLADLAARADHDADPVAATATLNLAALIASDVGLPDLARTWCHQHATTYLHARPLNGATARRALEPIVNLARLHIRDGHGELGFTLLDTLLTAATEQRTATIDGIDIPADLTATIPDHQHLGRWLKSVHMADGTRALTTAGRWPEALQQLERQHGIGRRMLDDRQVAVITAVITGDDRMAAALLQHTQPGEPWEAAVLAVLTVLQQHTAGEHVAETTALALFDAHRSVPVGEGLTVFGVRLGLTLLDAQPDPTHHLARTFAGDLVALASSRNDGYAARDILSSDESMPVLTEEAIHSLTAIVDASGLRRGSMDDTLSTPLFAAVDRAAGVLTRTLRQP